MKQWISKFRAQRLRGRLRESGNKAPKGHSNRFTGSSLRLLLGLALWVSVGVLFYTGRGEHSEELGWALGLARSELLLMIGTVVAAGLLRVLAPSIFYDSGRLLLLAMCGLCSVIPADTLLHVRQGLPWLSFSTMEFLIPLTLAPLLAGVLLGAAAATIVGVWVSYICAILFNNSLTVLVAGLITTAAAASMAPHARRRTQIIRIGVVVGLAKAAGAIVLLLGHHPPLMPVVVNQVLACLFDGIGSALIVVTILPLIEALFGLTTNITLRELSDLSHPLLQRLAFEAPGTYHHSLMVANLAQAAADTIGANPILARVGAYFHDIGKLTKPGFFTENIQGGENPHDNLAPSMSALLVMAHVKEGLSLAMLHKLPRAVMDIIQQHHGTGLVAYFHHKAGRQAEEAAQERPGRANTITVDQSPYRYPGPRPVSREASIIMLADAAEAASRSLEKPTPVHVGELIDCLVDNRYEDNQLDESEMTLAELAKVKQAFVLCLTSMLHSRIAYPRP
jgi:putative nucleotidyltransferase with HDIG domain